MTSTTAPTAPAPASLPDTRWRTRDIVVAAVIGVAFGVVFWVWGLIWYGPLQVIGEIIDWIRERATIAAQPNIASGERESR